MLAELLQASFIIGTLISAFRITTPILLAALGEVVVERGGIINLSVEGTMLIGAFAGFWVAFYTGSLWLGVAGAMLAGMALSLLMAFLVASLRVDQTVAGLTLNLFASGISFYLYRVSFGNVAIESLPTLDIFQAVPMPVLSRLPILGPTLFTQHALTYLAWALVPALFVFLYRSKYGLALRCIGDNPSAVDMKGVNVKLYHYLALMFGGALAGLGGGFLTLATTGIFVPNITAGRGWIAIAIVIFGSWRPLTILFASLFFGSLDSFQLQLQGIGVRFPYQFLLAIPYVLTILALLGNRARSGAPMHLGLPYFRE